MLLGLGRYFELWDRAHYDAFDAQVVAEPDARIDQELRVLMGVTNGNTAPSC